MKVVERPDGGGWCVVDDHGDDVAGPFASNADAWRWFDRLTDEEVIRIQHRAWEKNAADRRARRHRRSGAR